MKNPEAFRVDAEFRGVVDIEFQNTPFAESLKVANATRGLCQSWRFPLFAPVGECFQA
jgi:hypothetical protein